MSPRLTRLLSRLLVPVLAPPVALAAIVAGAAPARAASPNVTVAEVYGGGGNSGAPLRSDFVELFNRGTAAVNLAGWSVQYWSSTGTTASSTPLAGSIAAGGRYLVKEADGANTAAPPLPTPDATGTIAISATGGRVAVVNASGMVVDLLGWGSTAAAYEGAPAPGTSNTTSSTRTNACADTDNNAVDFASAPPSPQNSSTATVTCGPTEPPPVDEPETIPQVQGAGHLSPLAGKPVNGVHGIVTAVSPSGFWMQNPAPDADPATSEGILVFTRTAPTVRVADDVLVDGAVSEFRPGGSSGNDNLTTTQIVGPKVTVTGSGAALPAPVVIGVDRVAPQRVIEAGDPKNVEYATAPFRPQTDAIDFYESLEGMRVAVRDAQVVGPTKSFGEIPVVPGQKVQAVRSADGGVVYGSYAQPNAMRVQLDDGLVGRAAMPNADVGDRFAGDTVGVVDYSFSNYKLEVTSLPALVPGGLTREVTTPQTNNQLAVGTFNVENLAPSDPQTKFDRLGVQIVHNLQAPDILALEEIQDNSGAARDGVVDSTATTDKLLAAVANAGGPAYAARWVNPQDGLDGGQPGGNIRQVFIYRLDRDLEFIDRPGGDATTATTVVGSGKRTHLSLSPGRINPTSPAWTSSRKPLVGEFRFRGRTVFAIANHFNSKGGDDPLFGRWQQPVRSSETQRHQQAQEVRTFVNQLLAADPGADVVVVGDLNDFEFSQTTDILVGAGASALLDLPRTLPADERYTYVYEGNSQVLDHILVSRALTVAPPGAVGPAYEYDIVHTNSQFWDQDSDHEPQVVRLAIRGGTG